MKLSVAIMAHPARRHLVEDLTARLGIDAEHVVWDRYQDRWDTGVRAWQAHDPGSNWHVVLQDDALPCFDLLAGLRLALNHVPVESAVSLYLGDGSSNWRTKGAHDADRIGASWIRFRTLIWGVAIVVPTITIDDMLAWCEQHPQPNYDTRVARYYEKALGWPAYYTWPSLVDHRRGPSLLDHPDDRKAYRFIGEHASALDVDWSPRMAGDPIVLPHPITDEVQVHLPIEGVPMADLLIADQAAVIIKKDAKGRRSRTTIREGKIYRSDDPVVQGREHLFRQVEEATAVPGERRNVGRRGRKQAEPTPTVTVAKATPASAEPTAKPGDDDAK